MKKKIEIDDRNVSKPPYKGPKKDKLKDKQLTSQEIDDMLAKLFPETEQGKEKS